MYCKTKGIKTDRVYYIDCKCQYSNNKYNNEQRFFE